MPRESYSWGICQFDPLEPLLGLEAWAICRLTSNISLIQLETPLDSEGAFFAFEVLEVGISLF